jgi:two-component system, NtrC family, response regulator AtoC
MSKPFSYGGSDENSFRRATATTRLPPDEVIFGVTPALAAIRENLLKVAVTDVPVLLTGESGTGKELIANLIHACSRVANRAFVQVNAAAIPPILLESELFGHERGAFTGAITKPGRVELANSGTLFLDEIGEIDVSVQAKLLQFIQDGQFNRIGGQEDRKANVRLLLATSRNLREEVAAGNFREDLYYRINVVNLHLPPLRERLEDIPIVVDYMLQQLCDKHNFRRPPLSPATIQRFQEYHWPGNVRQLENLVKRYVVLGTEESILPELVEHESDVFKFSIPPWKQVSLKQITRQAIRQVERRVILKVVEANGWNRKRAAKLLNISYRTLLYKLKEVGVPSERRRTSHALAAKAAPPSKGQEAGD